MLYYYTHSVCLGMLEGTFLSHITMDFYFY